MFRVFQEEKLITICMFTCLGASIALRMLLGMLYRNMIKEADNMASTENRLLKQCKTKFASCYQMGNGVANIPIFVDKFLNRMALGHLSFETMYHLSGQLMLLSVVCSGIGVCKSIVMGRTVGEVLPFYIVSFFGLYLYFSVSTVVDVRGKKRVLKVNLVDYLENHLSPRIEVTRQDIEMLYGEVAFEEAHCGADAHRKPACGRRGGHDGGTAHGAGAPACIPGFFGAFLRRARQIPGVRGPGGHGGGDRGGAGGAVKRVSHHLKVFRRRNSPYFA